MRETQSLTGAVWKQKSAKKICRYNVDLNRIEDSDLWLEPRDGEIQQKPLCWSKEVSVTTGNKLFANKYLILTL